MEWRMLVRLYIEPLILMVAAVLTYFYLGIYIPEHLGGGFFGALADTAQSLAPVLSFIVMSAAFILALWRTWVLIQWTRGKGEICDLCDGPVRQKVGRYGFYLHCYACGKKQSLG